MLYRKVGQIETIETLRIRTGNRARGVPFIRRSSDRTKRGRKRSRIPPAGPEWGRPDASFHPRPKRRFAGFLSLGRLVTFLQSPTGRVGTESGKDPSARTGPGGDQL